jgi:hypothetical protein
LIGDNQTTKKGAAHQDLEKSAEHEKHEIPTFLALYYPDRQLIRAFEDYLNKNGPYRVFYDEGEISQVIPGRARNKSRPKIWIRLTLECSVDDFNYIKLRVTDFSSERSWLDFLTNETKATSND